MKYILLFTALLFVSIAHSQTTAKITDEEIYSFINQQIPDSSLIENRFREFGDTDNIVSIMGRFPEYFRDGDKEFMFQQISNQTGKIKKRLITGNAKKLISKSKIRWIFRGRDFDRSWNRFYKKKAKGFYRVSKPIFSTDRNIAIFYIGFHCGSLCGKGGKFIYKKKKDVWERVEISYMWVS